MNSLNDIFEVYKNINLFHNVGNDSKESDVVHVLSWKEAEVECASLVWGNVQLEERNEFSLRQSQLDSDSLVCWNENVDKVKKVLVNILPPKLLNYKDFWDDFETVYNSIYWDFMTIAMICNYVPLSSSPFYQKLLDLYIDGHFPCGWRGEWPDGQLVVY